MENDRRRSEDCTRDDVLLNTAESGISLTDDEEDEVERGKAAAWCREAEEQRTMLESRRPGMTGDVSGSSSRSRLAKRISSNCRFSDD